MDLNSWSKLTLKEYQLEHKPCGRRRRVGTKRPLPLAPSRSVSNICVPLDPSLVIPLVTKRFAFLKREGVPSVLSDPFCYVRPGATILFTCITPREGIFSCLTQRTDN